ncbi:MAG TPA: DUF86 domain-containing protein [Thermoanaerobaculia bacterium]|nr:DUF86 domain-containing protein [Thermoanaerobaculia bacterium]
MPKRDPGLLIEDMLTAIQRVERYTYGLDRTLFQEDEKTVDAVVRNLEILGEAARQMPEDFAARHPGIPWRQIAGLRNRIVHDYFGLDLDLIWQILQNDLPPLRALLEGTGAKPT